jgi:alpha/beta superfamily hydrolase
MKGEVPLRFANGSVELDGRLHVVPAATRACVLCHPHPLYGGDMDNNVVVALASALAAAGVTTLRFNFRGVGASTGSHGGGTAEVGDAEAATAALAAASGLPRVAIVGYSFGSVVAMRAATAANVARVAAIAPPLVMFDASFVTEFAMPLLLVAGDRDEYCPMPEFEALAKRLAATVRAVPLAGADHFLAGYEREVAGTVAGWMLEG